jgi:hypothetical protein
MTKCDRMANDVDRLASLMASLADGGKYRGTIQGPNGDIHYDIACEKMEKFGPGPCGTYSIVRHPRTPLARSLGLRENRRWVGNLHGLGRQLSRDLVRLYGCTGISETSGFEGRRR